MFGGGTVGGVSKTRSTGFVESAALMTAQVDFSPHFGSDGFVPVVTMLIGCDTTIGLATTYSPGGMPIVPPFGVPSTQDWITAEASLLE